MYVPAHFEETNTATLHSLINRHPLGAWVTQHQQELLINHIPFLIDSSRGQYGTLVGHVARANPVWKNFSREMHSIVIFQGEQGYISPAWYPGKSEHQRVVPTWNYAVVHAHGHPRVIEDKERLLLLVTQLTDRHESQRPNPWRVSDAPADYIEKMLGAIVGIEIPVERLVGKWKVSQNRSAADRLGVVTSLTSRGDTESLAMAESIESRSK